MKRIIEQALAETAEFWEPIQRAYRWVQAAAHVLAKQDNRTSAEVRQDFVRVLRSIGVTKRHCDPLEEASLKSALPVEAWQRLRKHLQYRHEARRQQWRFRKNPEGYLAALEQRLLQ